MSKTWAWGAHYTRLRVFSDVEPSETSDTSNLYRQCIGITKWSWMRPTNSARIRSEISWVGSWVPSLKKEIKLKFKNQHFKIMNARFASQGGCDWRPVDPLRDPLRGLFVHATLVLNSLAQQKEVNNIYHNIIYHHRYGACPVVRTQHASRSWWSAGPRKFEYKWI